MAMTNFKGIGSVEPIDKVINRVNVTKSSDAEIARRKAIADKIREQEEALKDPYTIITYNDLINLLVDYNIPVARQTVDALKKNKIFYIKGVLDTVRR